MGCKIIWIIRIQDSIKKNRQKESTKNIEEKHLIFAQSQNGILLLHILILLFNIVIILWVLL